MKISLLKQIFFPQHNGCCLCGSWADTEEIVCSACLHMTEKSRIPRNAVLRRGDLMSLAVWKHEGSVRRLIHQLKYRGNRKAAAFLGLEMANVFIRKQRDIGAVDLVIPVPLHPLREEKRGYNQALLLALPVCAAAALPLETEALARVKHTATQVRRTRKERAKAMEGAFAVLNASAVCGKRVLLVDDVMTTGATAAACAAALRSAGAADVRVLTAARIAEKGSNQHSARG